MTTVRVEVKVIIASEFGEKVTEISTAQNASEGNPRFFSAVAAGLALRCTDSIALMLQAEYGKEPDGATVFLPGSR